MTTATGAPTRHRRLLDWVEQVAALTTPDRVEWCDGSAEEWDRLTRLMVEQGTFEQLNPALRPNSFLALSDPGDVARVEDRTFICSNEEDRRRSDQQLARPDEMRATLTDLFGGCDARPHDVCHPVLDGTARLAHLRARRADHRLAVRGLQHADHDPDGPGRARRARRGRLFRALPALGRRAARARPGGRALAVQRDQQIHRAFPGNPRDLELRVRIRRQRAARQEVLRAADRLGHGPRRGLAGRAHAHPRAHSARR